MSKTKALEFVKNIRQLAENYGTEFNNIPNPQNYSPQFLAEKMKEHNQSLKSQTQNKIDSLKYSITQLKKEIFTKELETLFPLLTKSYNETSNLRGEQQVANAMLMFQVNYLSGNPDFVIESIKSAQNDSNRVDYVSTLLNQIVNYPIKNDRFQKTFDEAVKIKAEFEKSKGIPELKQSNRILNYSEKMTEVTTNLINKDFGGFGIPDYQEKFDFVQEMELARLSIDSDVDLSEFYAAPVDGISAPAAGE